MTKPIFLIGFPMEASNDAVFQVQDDLTQKLEGEYHVITYKEPAVTSIKFEVLNAISADDIQIEELIAKTSAFANRILEESNSLVQEIIDQNLVQEIIDANKNNPQ
jgi:hypothetical protein